MTQPLAPNPEPVLTHFDAQGQAHMVDVADKAITHRVARAAGTIHMQTMFVLMQIEARRKLTLRRKGQIEDARRQPAQFSDGYRCLGSQHQKRDIDRIAIGREPLGFELGLIGQRG